jgi:hypothetical protein
VLARVQVANDTAGFTRLIEWMAEHAPGPRVVAAVEGTRSYGIGLTRALTAAGLQVVECEQPARKDRRGRGKSDAIDAHLAVLFALRQDVDKLPIPRSDGPREALRILLCLPGRRWSPRALGRSTGCGRCCCPVMTVTGPRAAVRSPSRR